MPNDFLQKQFTKLIPTAVKDAFRRQFPLVSFSLDLCDINGRAISLQGDVRKGTMFIKALSAVVNQNGGNVILNTEKNFIEKIIFPNIGLEIDNIQYYINGSLPFMVKNGKSEWENITNTKVMSKTKAIAKDDRVYTQDLPLPPTRAGGGCAGAAPAGELLPDGSYGYNPETGFVELIFLEAENIIEAPLPLQSLALPTIFHKPAQFYDPGLRTDIRLSTCWKDEEKIEFAPVLQMPSIEVPPAYENTENTPRNPPITVENTPNKQIVKAPVPKDAAVRTIEPAKMKVWGKLDGIPDIKLPVHAQRTSRNEKPANNAPKSQGFVFKPAEVPKPLSLPQPDVKPAKIPKSLKPLQPPQIIIPKTKASNSPKFTPPAEIIIPKNQVQKIYFAENKARYKTPKLKMASAVPKLTPKNVRSEQPKPKRKKRKLDRPVETRRKIRKHEPEPKKSKAAKPKATKLKPSQPKAKKKNQPKSQKKVSAIKAKTSRKSSLLNVKTKRKNYYSNKLLTIFKTKPRRSGRTRAGSSV